MTKEELKKLVDIELQWVHYYSMDESRNELNENSDIYKDLKQMNYAKRVVPLYKRCCPCTITSDNIINKDTDISELKISDINLQGENKFSPIESYFLLYPDEKMDIINKLKYNYPNQI